MKSQDRMKYEHIEPDSNEAMDLRAELEKFRSIDDILDDIGLRQFHIKAYILLGFLYISDALEVSVLAIVLPSVKNDLNISSLLEAVLTLSLSLSMIAGSLFWGFICDKFGRKRGFFASASLILVFAFVSAFSPNYYWLWVSIFLVGFGISNDNQTYVMIMELFPPKYRSMFSVFFSLFWTIGFLLSAIASTQLSLIGYHWALAIVCFPAISFLIGIAFLPDSPHYHLTTGDEQKALSILQEFAPEMDLSNTTLGRDNVTTKRADVTQLFRSGYWKITICAFISTFTSFMVYYLIVYTTSAIAVLEYRDNITSNSSAFERNKLLHNSNDTLYSIMAWMNLPEFFILITMGIMCCHFTVKSTLLTAFLLTIILLFVAVILLNYQATLLVITLLSRSVAGSASSISATNASLLYPTENRSTGVGLCMCGGRIGMMLGPFIFEALFQQAYLKAIVFSIGSLLLGFVTIVFLPSRSAYLS